MDNIQRLEEQADYIANNLTKWEAESIARIARRCGKIGKLSKSEADKFDTEKEAKKEWERIVAVLAIATVLNIRSLKKAYTAEFEDWHKANKYLYDYRDVDFVEISKNKQMQGIIDDFVKQNGKDILNLTNTKALCVLDRNGKTIRFQDEIYKAFGEAVGYVKDGRTDFYSAMRQTIQNLGGGGCRVDYGGGITRRLDTVVRQNMLYGIKQSNDAYNEAIGKELGADGYEIDYHSNSRPTHRFMQGRQFCTGKSREINGKHFDGMEDTRDAESGKNVTESLQDYGCRHYKTAIICGVSEPRYSEEELKRFEEQEKKLYKIGDIEKDGYGWSQSMRAIESDIRKSKDEINALSALGGNEAKIKDLKSRIKTFQGKYDEISDITGIAKEKRRMSTYYNNTKKITVDENIGQNFERVIKDERSRLSITRNGIEINSTKLENTRNNMYVSDKVFLKPKQQHVLDKNITDAKEIMGIKDLPNQPTIMIVDMTELPQGTLASYNSVDNVLRVFEGLGDPKRIPLLQKEGVFPNNPLSTYVHELIHWQDAQKYISRFGVITSANYNDYRSYLNVLAKKHIDKLISRGYNINELSKYAKTKYQTEMFDEFYTEYRTKQILEGK